jgi:hypothetical protein
VTRRLIAAAVLLAVTLAGCGGDAEADSKPRAPRTRVELVTDWTVDGVDFAEYRVNGRPCVAGNTGLSCDWSAK